MGESGRWVECRCDDALGSKENGSQSCCLYSIAIVRFTTRNTSIALACCFYKPNYIHMSHNPADREDVGFGRRAE